MRALRRRAEEFAAPRPARPGGPRGPAAGRRHAVPRAVRPRVGGGPRPLRTRRRRGPGRGARRGGGARRARRRRRGHRLGERPGEQTASASAGPVRVTVTASEAETGSALEVTVAGLRSRRDLPPGRRRPDGQRHPAGEWPVSEDGRRQVAGLGRPRTRRPRRGGDPRRGRTGSSSALDALRSARRAGAAPCRRARWPPRRGAPRRPGTSAAGGRRSAGRRPARRRATRRAAPRRRSRPCRRARRRARPQRRGVHRRPLAHQLPEVELGLRAALHADGDQPPAEGQGVDVAGQVLGAHVVEDDVDPGAVGLLLHPLDEVLVAVVDADLARRARGRRRAWRPSRPW